MARLVLTDASPLIGLARVDGLPWLGALFGTVWTPPEVQHEVLPNRDLADEAAILATQTASWLQMIDPAPTGPVLPDLDAGESACIRIALANPEPCLLLMDERAGRAIAQEHGLAVAVVLSKEEYDELNDIKLQQLRAEINLGIADLESGAHSDYKADELPELAERVKAAGRERLAKK